MSFFDGKIDTFSSIISWNDGAVFFFFSCLSVGSSQKNNFYFIKATGDQNSPLDDSSAGHYFKDKHTFDFFPPHPLFERHGKRQQHQQRGNITAYVLFLCLADPDNCKHVKGVTGKQIRLMPLFSFFYTAFVSFQLHHVCTLRVC